MKGCGKYFLVVLTAIIVGALSYSRHQRYAIASSFSPRELVYKTAGKQNVKLDIYFPDDTLEKHKAVIYLHGGSWISGNKHKVLQRYRNHAVKTLTENHIVVISADYRLINLSGNNITDCLQDSREAVRYVTQNADFLKVDTSQIGLWGSSAGAHLSMLLFGKRDCDKDSIYKSIKFIIDDFGPTDINKMWQTTPGWFRKTISKTFYGIQVGSLQEFDSLSVAYSPISYAKQLSEIPVLIFQGSNDKIVNPTNSETLHKLLPNSKCYIYSGLGHGFKGMDSTRIKEYSERILDFIEQTTFFNK